MSDEALESIESTIEWRKNNSWYTLGYDILSLCSIGLVPIISVFYVAFGVRIKTVKCTPNIADVVITTIQTKTGVQELVSNVNREDSNNDEELLSFEVACNRYYASNIDDFKIHRLEDVPLNIMSLLKQQIPTTNLEVEDAVHEREKLVVKYGRNVTTLPQFDLFAILIRHALNPIIIFGYFAVIIWLLESYYYYSGFLILMLILSLYAMVISTRNDLKRLSDLAGRAGTVTLTGITAYLAQKFDAIKNNRGYEENLYDLENSVKGGLIFVYEIEDTTLVVGDQILLEDGNSAMKYVFKCMNISMNVYIYTCLRTIETIDNHENRLMFRRHIQ